MKHFQDSKVPLISESDAKVLLDRTLPIFRECIQNGWKIWDLIGEKLPEVRLPLSKTCRARIIYDHIVDCARRKLDGIKGVSIKESRGLLTVEVEDNGRRALLRFKKLDKKLRASNYPTQHQLDFSLQLVLSGWPEDATRLVAGYKLDEYETSTEMFITCPVGKTNEWAFCISEADDRTTRIPLQPSTPPSAPPEPMVIPLEELKEPKRKASDEDERNG